ncbi:hypothetical protein HII31_03629 [Pseudocercospora fuligena]|uniref:Uncharacterized protein n=1 Tax=Pseudocercospora fuligena TaxID=685502 RepID=A0A8H6RNB2_9PEZI|nr:hypothetical protein HII31_03629 [Pseudocercospora fuligena]
MLFQPSGLHQHCERRAKLALLHIRSQRLSFSRSRPTYQSTSRSFSCHRKHLPATPLKASNHQRALNMPWDVPETVAKQRNGTEALNEGLNSLRDYITNLLKEKLDEARAKSRGNSVNEVWTQLGGLRQAIFLLEGSMNNLPKVFHRVRPRGGPGGGEGQDHGDASADENDGISLESIQQVLHIQGIYHGGE